MKCTVIDRCNPNWKKEFKSKKEANQWIINGIFGCEGAERDHYVNMMKELSNGHTVLHYN